MELTGERGHVAVDGDDAGEAGQHGANGTFALGALAVDDVRLQFLQFASDGANASLVERAHPADFRHVQTVEINIFCQLRGRRDHGSLRAGDDVYF